MKEFYIWSVDADEAVGYFDTFSSDDGFVYGTVADAIAARDRGDDGMLHERLFRILRSAEEVEVPSLMWWRVESIGDDDIRVYATSPNPGFLRLTQSDGVVSRMAVVEAYGRDEAIAAAQQAWRDLAASLTGDAE